MHSKFDLTGVRTHDLQIMTVHFMSLRACSNHSVISDFLLEEYISAICEIMPGIGLIGWVAVQFREKKIWRFTLHLYIYVNISII